MVKAMLVLAAAAWLSCLPAGAQRPFYGTRGNGVLQVLPQYETELNRFGGSSTPAPPKPTDSNTLEDPDLINRVASWPRDKQPFWYLNSGYVGGQRRFNIPCTGTNCPTVPLSLPRSTFIRRNK